VLSSGSCLHRFLGLNAHISDQQIHAVGEYAILTFYLIAHAPRLGD
jgi:hypothetical protein